MCAMAMPQPHSHKHTLCSLQAPSNLVFDGVVRRRTRGHAGRVDLTFWVDGKTESFDAMQAREQRSQLAPHNVPQVGQMYSTVIPTSTC